MLPELDTCTKLKDGDVCGSSLKKYQTNNCKSDSNSDLLIITYLRCQKKGCQTCHSLRQKNPCFTYYDKNGKSNFGLALSKIVELVWYWVHKIPVSINKLD